MQAWQLPGGGLGTGKSTVVTLAFVALLIAAGCRPQKPPVQKPPVQKAPVVVSAGDIAVCAREGDEATAKLVEGIDGATVLTLGDNAYPEGSVEDFEECYEPTWGEFKNRSKPILGNHEYYTQGARGYFEYFGEAAGDPEEGYYSYELGSWHIVALNSNCGEAQIRCSPSSTQVRWLEEDLAANADDEGGCTLA
jgi:acid phosphatase type 7